MAEKYNLKNPAVKRILQEVKEMESNPSEDYMALPLEENIFEWQFAIRGPRDSEFEGGIYHGRIQLPADYPFQPPSFMMLTPNGRFETQTKICLSISNHHPEHWQPSWGVRTALVALIAFMPTKAEGALGSLEYPKDERHALAIKSREAPPKFGNSDRQKLIDEIHEYMLSKVPPQPPICPKPETTDEQIDVAEEVTTHAEQAVVMAPAAEEPNADAPGIVDGHRMVEDVREVMVEDVREVRMDANAGPLHVSFTAGLRVYRRVPASAEVSEPQHRPQPRAQNLVDDRWLTWLAIGLLIVIMALVLKKYMRSAGLANDGDEL
ncbi:Ubiquitin-conjugating enzyme E2 32 [Nymphaea thermarum]|nr:Ubiquitin-conjugating enzyme E2 32 [Nymphaea thermarum]